MYMMMIFFWEGAKVGLSKALGVYCLLKCTMNMERWEFCCIGFALILVISIHWLDDLFFLLCKEGRS